MHVPLALAVVQTPAPTPTPRPTPGPTETREPTSPVDTVVETVTRPFTQARDTNPCGPDDDLCNLVWDWTHNTWVAEASDWLIAKPLAVAAIIAFAVVLRWLLHRAITKLARRAAGATVPASLTGGRDQAAGYSPILTERRRQRAETMGSVLRSLTTAVIVVVAALMALAEVGLNIGPLLAGAGIVGVALGFGAQTLVKDFISGVFMILEDEYGVGDVVDLGEASGSVESVGLRVTRLRDVNGTVWYVRNGEVIRVGNKSQGWARAVIDVGVAYDQDIARAREVLLHTAHELAQDEAYRDLVLEEPEVWGVEMLSADSVVIRVVVKTGPLQQWTIARALRERIKTAFDENDIETPFPQRSVWVRTEGPGADGVAADAGEHTPPRP